MRAPWHRDALRTGTVRTAVQLRPNSDDYSANILRNPVIGLRVELAIEDIPHVDFTFMKQVRNPCPIKISWTAVGRFAVRLYR